MLVWILRPQLLHFRNNPDLIQITIWDSNPTNRNCVIDSIPCILYWIESIRQEGAIIVEDMSSSSSVLKIEFISDHVSQTKL